MLCTVGQKTSLTLYCSTQVYGGRGIPVIDEHPIWALVGMGQEAGGCGEKRLL